MKYKVLLLLLGIFAVSLVSAGTCNEPGYSFCWEDSNTFGSSTSNIKIYWGFEDDTGANSDLSDGAGLAIGNLYVKSGYTGTSPYAYFYTNKDSWDEIHSLQSCDENGCSANGFDFVAPQNQRRIIANAGESFTDCLAMHGVGYNDNGEYWSWTGAGYGWVGSGSCLNINVVECLEDTDCSGNQVCSRSGSWQDWQCINAIQCPNSVQYDSSNQDTQVIDCNVWQYFEEYSHCAGGGWYIYNLGHPELSDLIMTDAQYESLAPECIVECTTDNECPEDALSGTACQTSTDQIIGIEEYHTCEQGQCIPNQRNIIMQDCEFQCEIVNGDAQCVGQGSNIEICDDGIDNDLDGLIDNNDPDCETEVVQSNKTLLYISIGVIALFVIIFIILLIRRKK